MKPRMQFSVNRNGLRTHHTWLLKAFFRVHDFGDPRLPAKRRSEGECLGGGHGHHALRQRLFVRLFSFLGGVASASTRASAVSFSSSSSSLSPFLSLSLPPPCVPLLRFFLCSLCLIAPILSFFSSFFFFFSFFFCVAYQSWLPTLLRHPRLKLPR